MTSTKSLPERPRPGKRINRDWFPRFFDAVVQLLRDVDKLKGVADRTVFEPEYQGPWKVTVASSTSVDIGWERAASTYEYRDVINIQEMDGDQSTITKTAKETVDLTSIAGDALVYYEIAKSSGTWSATAKGIALASWPPSAVSDKIFIPLAVAWYNSGYTLASQLQRGPINIQPSPYEGPWRLSGVGTTSATVGQDRSASRPDIAMIHEGDDDRKDVEKTSSESTTVTVTSYIYYEFSESGGTWSGTLKNRAKTSGWPPTASSSNLFQLIGLAEISGGVINRIHQYTFGQINLFQPGGEATDEKVAINSDGTAGFWEDIVLNENVSGFGSESVSVYWYTSDDDTLTLAVDFSVVTDWDGTIGADQYFKNIDGEVIWVDV